MGAVSTSMTINAPAAVMLAFYVVAAERQGDRAGAAGGHDPDGHPEGVHRPEGVVLPDRPGDAAGDGHGRVLRAADAALAPDLDLRLPHPRGRLDGGAGAGVHAQGRLHLRRAGRSSAASHVDDFAPRLSLLLQRPHRLLRGDRQVPRRPADLGARAARHLRRARRALAADALPHPDRGGVADGAAAAQQRRPHGDRGAVGGAGRHPVAAHQQLRRGAGAADRGGRAAGAAHAADHRPRDRRRRTRSTRSAAPTSSRR